MGEGPFGVACGPYYKMGTSRPWLSESRETIKRECCEDDNCLA